MSLHPWQPIDTAPKTELIYLWDGSNVHQGSWVDIPFEEFRDPMGHYISQTDPYCGWISSDTGDELEPTHWQPIVRPHAPTVCADDHETNAYAEGRKDERAEWLPLLEAVRPFIEFNSSNEFITIRVKTADIAKARAAAIYVEGK